MNRTDQARNVSEKMYLYYILTNIDKVKIFWILHDTVALLTRRHSERGTRNCHEIIFRKLFTIIENVDQNMNCLRL